MGLMELESESWPLVVAEISDVVPANAIHKQVGCQ